MKAEWKLAEKELPNNLTDVLVVVAHECYEELTTTCYWKEEGGFILEGRYADDEVIAWVEIPRMSDEVRAAVNKETTDKRLKMAKARKERIGA